MPNGILLIDQDSQKAVSSNTAFNQLFTSQSMTMDRLSEIVQEPLLKKYLDSDKEGLSSGDLDTYSVLDVASKEEEDEDLLYEMTPIGSS